MPLPRVVPSWENEMSAGRPIALPEFQVEPAMTKTEFAYVRVREQIFSGELAPGRSIDQEALAAQLGLSTTPVREALRRLASERLVIIRAHRDTVVAPVSLKTLEESYVIRLELDPLAAGLAATNATDVQLTVLSGWQRPGQTDDDRLHVNRQLHRLIYAASGNSILTQTLDRIWDSTDRYWLITQQNEAVCSASDQAHADLVDAVLARRPERATRLMREHVASALDRIRSERAATSNSDESAN
jgi:DNA-binding GntR family transcriptional regulator